MQHAHTHTRTHTSPALTDSSERPRLSPTAQRTAQRATTPAREPPADAKRQRRLAPASTTRSPRSFLAIVRFLPAVGTRLHDRQNDFKPLSGLFSALRKDIARPRVLLTNQSVIESVEILLKDASEVTPLRSNIRSERVRHPRSHHASLRLQRPKAIVAGSPPSKKSPSATATSIAERTTSSAKYSSDNVLTTGLNAGRASLRQSCFASALTSSRTCRAPSPASSDAALAIPLGSPVQNR